MADIENTNEPQFFKADTRLKEKIGNILKNQAKLDPDALKKAESILDNSSKDFISEAEFSLSLVVMMMNDRTKFSDEELLMILHETAFSLKSRGGTYGFQLVSVISDMLLKYLEKINEIKPRTFKVLESHVSSLRAVIGSQIRGDGGARGIELINNLKGLADLV